MTEPPEGQPPDGSTWSWELEGPAAAGGRGDWWVASPPLSLAGLARSHGMTGLAWACRIELKAHGLEPGALLVHRRPKLDCPRSNPHVHFFMAPQRGLRRPKPGVVKRE